MAPTNLHASVVAGPQVNLDWDITGIVDESGYQVQRRDVTAGGTFATLTTVGPNVATYHGDAGPFTTGHRYAYRIRVVDGESDGQISNTIIVFGSGATDVPTTRLSVLDDELSR